MIMAIYVLMIIASGAMLLSAGKLADKMQGREQIRKTFQQICLKEKVEKEEKDYIRKKIMLAGIAVLAGGIIGIGYAFSAKGGRELKVIQRPGYGEGVRKYEISVENVQKKKKESLKLQVEEREYSQSELKEVCNQAFDKWLPVFLGTNESANEVTGNLNLISEVEGYPVVFDYILDEGGYIKYDGAIDFGQIPFENAEYTTELTVICSAKGYQCQKLVEITIKKPPEQSPSLQSQVQSLIDGQKPDGEEIILPENVDNQQMKYYEKENEYLWIFAPIGILFAIAVFKFKDKDLDKLLKKRRVQMENDYSEIVSMISLLQGAGQSIRKSWERIIMLYEKGGKKKYAYEEMKLAKNKMDNGIPEIQAYREFGKRCGIHEYIKLANILEQNITKGSHFMRAQLEQEVSEAAQSKLCYARKQAEESSTKLLFPMILMLVVVMVILIVPAFLSMNLK